MHRKINVSLLAGIALAISASSVFGITPASAAKKPPKIKEISTPGKYSQWAFVEKNAYVFNGPSKSSGKVGRLKLKTFEKTDNLVYVEAQTTTGAIWYRIRIPGKSGAYTKPDGSPGGQSVWVPRSALGALQAVSTYLKIDRAARTITYTKGGKVRATYRVGVGKDSTPTPPGEYYVRMKMSGFAKKGGRVGPYGRHAFGLSATSEQLEKSWPGGGFIGIHGTNEPKKIPGAPSHGCVRMLNPAIDGLFPKIPVGTPVTIV